ncbi:hypothetical protein ANACOL_00362 [Anaerotruncus colihominis DSM 17241]|uniref:Uncharacterized protein n=1 Tax=Anaerotruncus colihominis DSM 17241 TaxID=445972 RepID=B0P6I5_9FIRM|nr:hypothetical protein ANACOL_00362 [Anaerotruncus colihominis DSM 17241]
MVHKRLFKNFYPPACTCLLHRKSEAGCLNLTRRIGCIHWGKTSFKQDFFVMNST